MPKTLFGYYKKAILYPAGILLAFYGLAFYAFHIIYNIDDWENFGDAILIIGYIMILINVLTISILSTTIFLNMNPAIRNSPFLSGLAWFLLPIVWVLAINIYMYSDPLIGDSVLSLETFLLHTNTIPYLVMLVITFISFRKSQA